MDDCQPRRYFLSRKTVLKSFKNNIPCNVEGVSVIVEPALLSKELNYQSFLAYSTSNGYFKPSFFYNGAYLSHDDPCDQGFDLFHLLEEKDGLLKRSKQYRISWSALKRNDFQIKLITNDLKYAIIVNRFVRQATLIKPLKTEIFLHIAKCSKLSDTEDGIQSYVAYCAEECPIFTENKRHFKKKDFRIATVICGMISPQQTYLCLVIHDSNGIHLNVYRMDVENKVVNFHSSVDLSMEFLDNTYLDIKMDDAESVVMVKQWIMIDSTRRAILYSVEDGLLHPISCNSEMMIRFCFHLDHVLYGYLVFLLLQKRHKKEFFLEILKYGAMGLERWIKINASEEFGLKNHVQDFFVQGCSDTRVFVNDSHRMLVINPFKGKLLYLVEQTDNVESFMNVYVNWNSQEIFGVRKGRDNSFEFLVYYLPKDNELSLKHSAAIVAIENYPKSYLKTLNLPKNIKYLLGLPT